MYLALPLLTLLLSSSSIGLAKHHKSSSETLTDEANANANAPGIPGTIGSFKSKDCSGPVEAGQLTNVTHLDKCYLFAPAADAQSVQIYWGQGGISFNGITTYNDTKCDKKAMVGGPSVPDADVVTRKTCYTVGTPEYAGNFTGMQAFYTD